MLARLDALCILNESVDRKCRLLHKTSVRVCIYIFFRNNLLYRQHWSSYVSVFFFFGSVLYYTTFDWYFCGSSTELIFSIEKYKHYQNHYV